MLKIITHILILGLLAAYPGGKLKIIVSNIDPVEGTLYIAVYDNEKDFMVTDSASYRRMISISDTTETVTIDEMEEGTYAIAIFQDLNGNGQLDASVVGIPQEPFGFSNDARGKLGPPKYKKAAFRFSGDKEIVINLVNDAKK